MPTLLQTVLGALTASDAGSKDIGFYPSAHIAKATRITKGPAKGATRFTIMLQVDEFTPADLLRDDAMIAMVILGRRQALVAAGERQATADAEGRVR